MNNFNEERLLNILKHNELNSFFKQLLDAFIIKQTENSDLKNFANFIFNQPSLTEYKLLLLILFNSLSTKKLKDYFNACFNLTLTNDQINIFEYNLRSTGFNPNYSNEILSIADSFEIRTTFCFSILCGYLKYLSVYNVSENFDKILVRTIFLNQNLNFLPSSIQLIDFLIEYSFNPLINKTEIKQEYYNNFFFKLFNKELFDNLANFEENSKNCLNLGVKDNKNEQLFYFRDFTCIYFIFQYRLSLLKLREKYLLSSKEIQTHFEEVFKSLTFFQSYDLAGYNLMNLSSYLKTMKLNGNFEYNNSSINRLENSILMNLSQFYTILTNLKIRNNLKPCDELNYLPRKHFIACISEKINFNNLTKQCLKTWEDLFYRNPILTVTETLTKLSGNKNKNFFNIDNLEIIIKDVQNIKAKINLIRMLISCLSIITQMMDFDLSNYGFLIPNSQQMQIAYVNFT
jgi:hypothetical protein